MEMSKATGSWQMWAHRHPDKDPPFWDVFPSAGQVRMCSNNWANDKPLQVTVTADPEGPYWGWMATGESRPCMIFPHLTLLKVCFPYGLDVAIQAGQGLPIRLSVAETPLPEPL